jgi:hypothetical protein
MVTKKDLIIAVLATFCLTATIFMVIPTRSSTNPYDAMIDSNHDGKISLADLVALANSYGASGDPTLKVSIVPSSTFTQWIYTVPFIVNEKGLSFPSSLGVTPGVYETDILVHNAEANVTVNVTKKVVVAYQESDPMIPPVQVGSMLLPPDWAFRIDSAEIINYIPQSSFPGGASAKGWVGIIASSSNLDVVAFYTVAESIPGIGFGNPPTPTNTTSIETLTITPKPYT